MKILIIFIFFIQAQSQYSISNVKMYPTDKVKKDFIDNYIQNNGSQNHLNLLVIRSLQEKITNNNWVIIDTLLNNYITEIGNNYVDFDLNHLKEIKIIINQNDNQGYEVNFINKAVNTNDNETDPLIISFEDSKYLYFTRKPRTDESYDENIFVGLEEENFIFSDIVPLPFNTRGNPEAVSFVSESIPLNLIYYGHYGNDIRGNLYMATFADEWSEPVKLNPPVNSENFELDGILYQEKYMLFASDRPDHGHYNPKGLLYNGDYWGNTDIYVSERLGENEWSTPINLGKRINTKFGERTPWLSNDGLTLYFSSDGHPGLGRMDVFKSTRTDRTDWTSWSVPQNLGKRINTPFNEIGYSIYEDNDIYAFFSTSSNMIVNDYDIAYVQLSKRNSPIKNPIIIKGNVKDKNGPIDNLPIVAEDNKTGEKLGEALTDKDGNYELPLPHDSDPNIYPKTDDYIPQTKPLENPLLDKDRQSNTPEFNQAPRIDDGSLDLGKIEEDWNKYLKKDDIQPPPGFGLDKDGNLIPPSSNDDISIKDLNKYYEKYGEDLWRNKFRLNDGVYRYLESHDFDLKKPAEECKTDSSILTTVTFDSKSSKLSEHSKFELDRLSSYLKKNEDYFMLVIGHTDSDSSRIYNKNLSNQRAISVKDYLVSKGCNDYQFFTIGKGEDMLLTEESTPYLKRKNRRVEFCISTGISPEEFQLKKDKSDGIF